MDCEIDESWTEEFREVEGPYDRFYKESARSVKLFFLYVDNTGDLTTVKSERVMLDGENILKKDTLCGTIKNKEMCEGVKYKFRSLLRFNIDAEPEDALEALNNAEPSDYTHDESYMRDIRFQDTICTFQDLNSLFFLYQEAMKTDNKRGSRRVVFKTLIRKTRRKRA